MKNYLNNFSLKNKKAVVIGGCGLIGEKICESFLSAGSKVTVIDFDKKKGNLLKKKFKSFKFVFEYLNISDLENLENNINIFFKKNGCPDIFVNCSYPVTKDWKFSSFKKNKLKILRKNVDISLNSGSWLAYKTCEKMREKKIKGTVILFGSTYGFLGQNMSLYKDTKMNENMNYSIIKGGIINFSRQLASYYGKFGLRINTISPGGVKGHVKGSKNKQDKKFLQRYSALCPMKRLATPEEIANSTLFLASDASTYITGTNFVVDGGWSII